MIFLKSCCFLCLAATTLAKAKTLDPTNNGIDEMIKQLDDLKLCESTQDEEEEEPHVPKLIEKGEFTPRFKEILTEIFDQFDEGREHQKKNTLTKHRLTKQIK